MSEVKLTGLKDVVAWLECQPQWSGVAVRRVDDPPIPGEPFISMESAKHLIVSAVSIMDNRSLEAAAPPASPAPVDGERVRAAKIEAFDEALSIAEGSYSYGEQQNEIIAGIRAALAAINGEK